MAEGVARFHPEAVEIAVPDVDPFMVIFMVQVPVQVAEFIAEGDIRIGAGPAVGQPAAGVHPAGEDVRQGIAALLALLAEEDHRGKRDAFQRRQVHGGAAVDDQDGFGIMGRQEAQAFGFFGVEVKIAGFQLFVAAFPGLAGDDIECRIGAAPGHVIFRDLAAQRENEGQVGDVHQGVQALGAFHGLDAVFVVHFEGGCQLLLVFVQPVPAGEGEAGVFEPFGDADGVAFIHFAGAGPAFDGGDGAGAVQGDLPGAQRQGAVVFQQHDAFPGGFPGERPVGCFPRAYRLIRLCPDHIPDLFHVYPSKITIIHPTPLLPQNFAFVNGQHCRFTFGFERGRLFFRM